MQTPRKARPRLESLEGRLAPATLSITPPPQSSGFPIAHYVSDPAVEGITTASLASENGDTGGRLNVWPQ